MHCERGFVMSTKNMTVYYGEFSDNERIERFAEKLGDMLPDGRYENMIEIEACGDCFRVLVSVAGKQQATKIFENSCDIDQAAKDAAEAAINAKDLVRG